MTLTKALTMENDAGTLLEPDLPQESQLVSPPAVTSFRPTRIDSAMNTRVSTGGVFDSNATLPPDIRYHDVLKLLEKQYSGLLNLLRRQLRDRELAADLVNEAITVALEHARAGRITELDRMGGYVFKISMNLLRNHKRSHANRSDKRLDIDALSTQGINEADDIEAAQLRNRAKKLIESLHSTRDREVIRRFYLEEETKESICAKMNLTALQFTQVMSRARQRMKKYFDAQGLKSSDYLSLLL